MTTEEKLVRDNADIIRLCAIDFMNERHMPYSVYYEDVLQEAVIGFLKWHRKMEAGAFGSTPAVHKYLRTSVRYHLYNQFIHQHGIHRNPKKKCDIMIEDTPNPDLFTEIEIRAHNVDDDIVSTMDIARWVSTLTPQDRLVVQMILGGYKPKDIESRQNMKASQYQWQKRRIGKSYRAYFGEAG